MTTIIIAALVISQLLCFSFIVLLNAKISKFKQIEKNQETLLEEVEATISVYLIDLKEENDRLIRALSERKADISNNKTDSVAINERPLNESNSIIGIDSTTKQNLEQTGSRIEQLKIVPKSVAKNAYKKNTSPQQQQVQETPAPVEEVLVSFEKQVVQLYKNGLTIDEIAKKTQKGKTEIELLIKFHA